MKKKNLTAQELWSFWFVSVCTESTNTHYILCFNLSAAFHFFISIFQFRYLTDWERWSWQIRLMGLLQLNLALSSSTSSLSLFPDNHQTFSRTGNFWWAMKHIFCLLFWCDFYSIWCFSGHKNQFFGLTRRARLATSRIRCSAKVDNVSGIYFLWVASHPFLAVNHVMFLYLRVLSLLKIRVYQLFFWLEGRAKEWV